MTILIYLICVNLLTAVLYVADKSAARNGTWRVSEANLQFVALLGGTPAALYCAYSLRHKIKKEGFMNAIYLSIGFQIIALSLVLSGVVDLSAIKFLF